MAISLAAETQPPAFKLYLCIAVTVFCWGYSPIGVHSALHSYTPQHIALLRFLIASFFLLLLVIKKGNSAFKVERCSCARCIRIFLCNAASFADKYRATICNCGRF